MITGGTTVTTAFAVSQFVGFNTSQIEYVTVYVPAGVPAATVIVPLAFNVKPVGTVTPVKVTSDGLTTTPFNVSFVNTEAVVAPVYPLIGP